MNDQPISNTHPEDSTETSLTLATPIRYAPNVGHRRATLYERLGITRIAHLIKHLPHRYEYQAGESAIDELAVDTIATARGIVAECRWVPSRGSPIGRPRGGGKGRFTAAIDDRTHRLELVWFNASYLRDKIHPGVTIAVTGKVVLYNGVRQMANPRVEIIATDADQPPDSPEQRGAGERYRPIYPSTEGLTSPMIERAVEDLLPIALPQIEDHFTDDYRKARNLPTLADAYRKIHVPEHDDDVLTGRRRLAYDELLLLQLGFAIKRQHVVNTLHAPALNHSDAIDEHIRARFPFELTEAQDAVVKQIARDLGKAVPMNRLLQGDVGSGKTIVALYAMLMAVADSKQAALMAPTELLAEQHFVSISAILEGANVRTALLTGSMRPGERAAAVDRIERGEIDLVIGTQAIISDAVRFHDLAVVIIDEQHRFGVAQRAAIRSKTGDDTAAPHVLVMTATPIPRTLSLTIFGDLDVSTITQLPPGRQPIATRVVPEEKSAEVYGYLRERLDAGEQAYIVLPAIDEDTTGSGLKAVRTHMKELEAGPLEGKRLAAVHGQLKRVTRERIMHRFRNGEIDALVATTVIEVGVDVPNASVMVVEHAERFGLAQLHQLRGRVGRGKAKSLCVFIADPTTDDAAARMEAIGSTTDGFTIAEHDLNIRGMGELVGTRQSGLPPLRVADLTKHLDLLRLARQDAVAIAEADPRLREPHNELLRKRLVKEYGEALGLADVA